MPATEEVRIAKKEVTSSVGGRDLEPCHRVVPLKKTACHARQHSAAAGMRTDLMEYFTDWKLPDPLKSLFSFSNPERSRPYMR